MTPEPESLTVASLMQLLYNQVKAGNGHHSVTSTLDGVNYSIASVANDPGQLALIFGVRDRDADVDVWGSKRIRWLFPRIGTNNDGIDVLRIDVKRTLGIEPLLIGYDGNRKGWTILSVVPQDTEGSNFIAQEIAFLPTSDAPKPQEAFQS